FLRGRHVCDARDAFARARAFVVSKKERLVAFDWATKRAAKLVADVFRLRLRRGCEEVTRVERGVAVELEERTVKVVGARIQNHVDLRARIATERRIVSAGQHFKLPNRIDGRTHAKGVQLRIDVVNTVEQKVVCVFPRAVDAECEVAPN